MMLVTERPRPADAPGVVVAGTGLPPVASGVWFPSPELTL